MTLNRHRSGSGDDVEPPPPGGGEQVAPPPIGSGDDVEPPPSGGGEQVEPPPIGSGDDVEPPPPGVARHWPKPRSGMGLRATPGYYSQPRSGLFFMGFGGVALRVQSQGHIAGGTPFIQVAHAMTAPLNRHQPAAGPCSFSLTCLEGLGHGPAGDRVRYFNGAPRLCSIMLPDQPFGNVRKRMEQPPDSRPPERFLRRRPTWQIPRNCNCRLTREYWWAC